MSVRAAAVLISMAILTTAVRAQMSTADGVAAFARGDYQRAVDILKPNAERLIDPDHTAEFFMAMLYAAGRGVPLDELRACAL